MSEEFECLACLTRDAIAAGPKVGVAYGFCKERHSEILAALSTAREKHKKMRASINGRSRELNPYGPHRPLSESGYSALETELLVGPFVAWTRPHG